MKKNIFSIYNSFDLLLIFAGISLFSENHGKNIRLENLAIDTLRNNNTNSEKISFQEIRDFFKENYLYNSQEDIAVNLFTDNITFFKGDYIIFPGITENSSFILSNLLEAIFQFDGIEKLDKFQIFCVDRVFFILAISNIIAKRLNHTRYQTYENNTKEIFTSTPEELRKVKEAVLFSTKDINKICENLSINKNVINDFLMDLNDITDDILLIKPIVKINDNIIISSPTTLSYAITNYLWKEAEKWEIMEIVNNNFHFILWSKLQPQLNQMGFNLLQTDIPINQKREGLYQFDEDKIAYIEYFYDDGTGYTNSEVEFNFYTVSDELKEHRTNIYKYLLSNEYYSGYKVFNLLITSSIGRDFPMSIDTFENTINLTIPIFEIDVLYNLKETDAIDLWNFANAYKKLQNHNIYFSFLDFYRLYIEHEHSFYLSDETKYSFVQVISGYSEYLIHKSIIETDKHSVLKRSNEDLVTIEVQKKDKYAPIYMNLFTRKFELLVEGFHQSIWVSPKINLDDSSLKESLRDICREFGDAIAYWLWQIREDIKPKMKSLGNIPISFNFTFQNLNKFANIKIDLPTEKRNENNIENKFNIKVFMDSVLISIPSEILTYLYGENNEGDRILVKIILLAINKILSYNNLPLIKNEQISQIVETRAPLGKKKKIFIIDTNDNFLLDKRNLKPFRYLQDYNSNIIMDLIIPNLKDMSLSVGKIEKQKDKSNLLFNVTQGSLLPLLRKKIDKYNSISLLGKLIELNESLITHQQYLYLNTPTRIECFVSIEQHQIDLRKKITKLGRTMIAIRCLIEHIAAEPCTGSKNISTTAIDELIAIMDQIIYWGSISDQVHYNLFNIDISILPTNRIGVKKDPYKKFFDPYYQAKISEIISDTFNTYKYAFPQTEEFKENESIITSSNLDRAFELDYGVSFSRICEFMQGLIIIGLLQNQSVASLNIKELKEEIDNHTNKFDEEEFNNVINYLSLENRKKVDSLPEGYEFIDIMPWRFNRRLSLLRKPLVIVEDKHNKEKIVYWGFRQVLLSRIYLYSQCYSDRLRVPENSNIKRVLGKISNKRGELLVNKIFDCIQSNDLIIDKDVYIGPSQTLKNKNDIGDIDILIIDKKEKLLLSLECKSMMPSRNSKEMVEEVKKLFDDRWIEKHTIRHEWLESNRNQVSLKYGLDINDYTIKSFFITQEAMLTPYLKKHILPLIFLTSYEIEKEGYKLFLN